MTKVKILLIAANTERVTMAVLPLGLAQVAAATEAAGHDVSLVNLCPGGDGPADDPAVTVRRAIDSFQPGIIGISVRNIDDQHMQAPRFLLEPVRDVIRACRAATPAPVVVGGAGFSIFPGAALAYLGADLGIRGEGEAAFPTLVSALDEAKGLPEMARVLTAPSSANLDAFPPPQPGRWLASTPRDCWVPVQSRRGCPLGCSYCSTASIEGHTVRRRLPGLVADDLARARAAGFRGFYFVDNTFNLPESYALRLCHEIAQRDVDVAWRCIVYPRKLSENLARALQAAGCVEASVGFEAGNEPMLAALGKRFSVDEVRTTCARLADHGIRRHGFLLLGGPGETRQSIEQSMAFAASLRLDTLKVTLGIRIYPGTPLHRTALSEGVVSPEDDLLQPRFYLARGLDPPSLASVFASYGVASP